MRVIYCCAGSASFATQYIQRKFSEALAQFTCTPDAEVRLISKALLARLGLQNIDTMSAASLDLRIDDVERIIKMLNSDGRMPTSFHGLPFQVLFSILKDIATVSQNLRMLVEDDHDIPSILAELSLSEKLSEHEQAESIELLWILMQYGSSDKVKKTEDSGDSKSNSSESHAEESLQQDTGIPMLTHIIQYNNPG